MLRVLVPPRRALLLRTIPTVAVLVGVKVAVDFLGWEFISISPLHTSIVAGAIFIVGLMLTGTMSDYKESERLPTDTAAALEAIYREGTFVKARWPAFDLDRLTDILARVPHTLRGDLVDGTNNTINTVEELTDAFIEMDDLGVPPNYVARMKEAQAQIVRNLMRVAYIQRIDFLPSAFTLVELILTLLIALLMFTQVASRVTDAILLGFISLIFLYILRLLRVLDSPFRASGAGLDDVSLYQIDSIHEQMAERALSAGTHVHDDSTDPPSR